ncbi:hypothetical protein EYF80_046328 [Liparis tanakae]|uniref:Uncharacterized protein n=1 Tax=Liparis tanakae TaxID=230148 RepID=A0A4Z2FRI5_9TELE|nr:hypothetical protein EYF80_046328 [Liparis tanakae]
MKEEEEEEEERVDDGRGHSSGEFIVCVVLVKRQGVPGYNVLGYVGEAGHHTAAQGIADHVHATCLRPLIGRRVVALDVGVRGEAVVAPGDKDPIVEHSDAEVLAGSQHGRHLLPAVVGGVVRLCCVQARRAAGVAPFLSHRRDETPLVDLGPVALGRSELPEPVEASQGVDALAQHGDAQEAAALAHGGGLVPELRAQVEPADAVQTLPLVEAADGVEAPVEDGGAVEGAGLLVVVRQADPVVAADVVRLDHVGCIVAAPASDGQQDGVRQARAGEGVAELIERGLACPDMIHGVPDHGPALSVGIHELIGQHLELHVVDPAKDGLEGDALVAHVEVVSLEDGDELLQGQQRELFVASDGLEVTHHVAVGPALQFGAVDDVGEPKDADAVLLAEPLPEEVAAGLHDAQHAELVGRQQQLLHVVHRH